MCWLSAPPLRPICFCERQRRQAAVKTRLTNSQVVALDDVARRDVPGCDEDRRCIRGAPPEEQPASQRHRNQKDACQHPGIHPNRKRYTGAAPHAGHSCHGSVSCVCHVTVGVGGGDSRVRECHNVDGVDRHEGTLRSESERSERDFTRSPTTSCRRFALVKEGRTRVTARGSIASPVE